MSVLLARLRPSSMESYRPGEWGKFARYLPFPASQFASVDHGAVEAGVWSFNAALDRPVQSDPRGTFFFHGYGGQDVAKRARGQLEAGLPLGPVEFPESFCAVSLQPDRISFGSSASGVDPLFFLSTPSREFIVTNRHNLLAPWLTNLPLRKEALAWMAGRGHIGDWGTYWDGVARTRPGSVWTVDTNALPQEHPASFVELYRPMTISDIADQIAAASDYFSEVITGLARPTTLWLSGGKDSRAILGLISRGADLSLLELVTHGERFAPDVMAATDVVAEMGLGGNHKISPAAPTTQGMVDFPAAIARDLLSDSIGSSLADLKGVNNNSRLVLGGHENGFKTGYNRLALTDYIASRKYWVDNGGLLRADYKKKLLQWYEAELRSALADAPMSRYGQVDTVMFRNATYAAGALTNTHVSGSEIHPFLDGRLARLLFGASDAALASQFIHYAMMRQAPVALESLPFAADTWPQELPDIARSAGLPFRDPPQPPYRFKEYFPSQKSFGAYSWRLDLCRQSRSFVTDYIVSNSSYFDFIELDRFKELQNTPEDRLKLTTIYTRLSLFKMCLIHALYQGDTLCDFSRQGSLKEAVSALTSIRSPDSAGSRREPAADFRAVILDHEVCIATQERTIRALEKQVADLQIIESADPAPEADDDTLSSVATLLDAVWEKNGFRPLARTLGLQIIRKSGMEISRIEGAGRYVISGVAADRTEQKNALLIALKGAADARVPGFIVSDTQGFLFRYINATRTNPTFRVEIDLSEVDASQRPTVWILPWYAQSPIFVGHVTIHRA